MVRYKKIIKKEVVTMYIKHKYYINSGRGKSKHCLVSFDEALRDMGLEDYNLMKISSILPAYSKQEDHVNCEKGSFLPTAYSNISSNMPGDSIASAVGVAIPIQQDKDVGVIMEFSAHCSQIEAEKTIESMLREAMLNRHRPIKEIIISANEATIPENNDGEYTTLVSAISIWPAI